MAWAEENAEAKACPVCWPLPEVMLVARLHRGNMWVASGHRHNLDNKQQTPVSTVASKVQAVAGGRAGRQAARWQQVAASLPVCDGSGGSAGVAGGTGNRKAGGDGIAGIRWVAGSCGGQRLAERLLTLGARKGLHAARNSNGSAHSVPPGKRWWYMRGGSAGSRLPAHDPRVGLPPERC